MTNKNESLKNLNKYIDKQYTTVIDTNKMAKAKINKWMRDLAEKLDD